MTRDITPIKWIIGAIALLIIVAGACYFWYQHSLADERKAAADAQQLLRQSETERQAKAKSSTAKQAGEKVPAESETPTAEKPKSDATALTDKTEPTQAQTGTAAPTAETQEVRVSPFGFGPYPEVPEDYPSVVVWLQSDYEELSSHAQKNFELMSRVLIKLWASGEKSFRGASTYKGKVYPHYYNTVYIKVSEYELPDGTKSQYISRRKSGPHVNTDGVDLLNPPSHLRVLDLDSSGIDPYQYLNLR
ncbi:MAG: hypothetical protein OXM61_11680 [Candidatus Poribacteria bacterium]|nr:hypothetical protein [Candidatus Poribacteria bacterium]